MYAGDYMKDSRRRLPRLETTGKYVGYLERWQDHFSLTPEVTAKATELTVHKNTFRPLLLVSSRLSRITLMISLEVVDDYEIADQRVQIVAPTHPSMDYSWFISDTGALRADNIAIDFDLVTYYWRKCWKLWYVQGCSENLKLSGTVAKYHRGKFLLWRQEVKLQGTVEVPNPSKDKTETNFPLPSGVNKFTYFKCNVRISKTTISML